MPKDYILGVDTNLALSKTIEVEYNKLDFIYIPRFAEDKVDNIVCTTNKSSEEVYKLITEFISIISFEHNCIMLPVMLFSQPNIANKKCPGNVENRRSVSASLNTDFLKYTLQVKYPTDLMRLFRIARSSNSIYLAILFYWHIMSSGNFNDNHTEQELNSYIEQNNATLSSLIKRIKSVSLFGEIKSLGSYIHDGIRHSIAHIERNKKDAKNLELDSLKETHHLLDIETILHAASCHKIKKLFIPI